MIKEERLNTRKVAKRVAFNHERLSCSRKSMQDIYRITFLHPEFTFFNIVKNDEVKEITYGDVKKQIELFANHFQKTIADKSKYVGLLLENSPEWVSSYYGLLMAGYIPVLLSTAATKEENEEILEQLHSKYVVTNKEIGGNKINPFEIEETMPIENPKWENGVVLVTSGTSGKSKIYLYTGEELSNQLLEVPNLIKRAPNLGSTYKGYIKQFLILPLYHIFGFTSVFSWFSFHNITFVLPESLAADKVKEAALLTHPTHLMAVPLFWELISKKIVQAVKDANSEEKFEKALKFSINFQKRHPKSGPKFVQNRLLKKYINQILGPSFGFCVTGGTAISEETLRILNGLGYPLVNGYGSTEIGITSFSNTTKVKDRLSLTIGKPFTNYNYEISKDNELLVMTRSGYHSMLVDGEFVERNVYEPIRTNDICEIDFNNRYYIKGRLDELYIGRNGENYSLPRIEKSLKANYATDLVCFVKDDKLALLLSYDKAIPVNVIKKDLSGIIHNENFTKYSIRNILVTNDELPKANTIKIKRNELVKLLDNGTIRTLEIPMDDQSAEEIKCDQRIVDEIVKIFGEVTQVEKVEKDSDFFIDLGGDSLSYFDLVTKIESRFGLTLEININVTRTPLQFALKVEEIAKNENKDLNLAKTEEKSENIQEKQVKFNFFHFLGRCFIKITGYLPYLIFVTPRFFYASHKAKKESKKLKGGAIIIGNHSSTFDYVTLMYKHLFRVIHTFVGPAIYRFGSLRHLCNVLENIEVKKDDPANIEALRQARAYLNKGKTVCLFPEGRFEDNPGEIERFSSSAIRLSFETNKPIIPHYFKGNYGIFKRAKFNVGEKIYVRDLVDGNKLTNEDIERINKYLQDTIKKLKHQLQSYEITKTKTLFSKTHVISDIFKIFSFPFGYCVFPARKIYIGDKKKYREAMRDRVLLAPSHTSFYDVPIIYAYFISRRLRVLALKKAVSGKFLHPLTRGAGVIEYDRDAKGGFDIKSFKETDQILEANGAVVMFPQGHIVDNNDVSQGDLKQGLALHSLRRNVPIIPIVFGKVTRPLQINPIYIGDPLYPSDFLETVDASRENIAKFTDILREKMIELQSIAKNYSKKKEK